MDRRFISDTFRDRLALVQDRSGLRQAPFAKRIGIDRSALSQLLTGAGARLPRADTLASISSAYQVSVDWLLGLSDESGIISETRDSVDFEYIEGGRDETLMSSWHEQAMGQKIRYVPSRLPDLLRTPDVIAFEADRADHPSDRIEDLTAQKLNYSRKPESDMELCMPAQRLKGFAAGADVWAGLGARARRRQLLHIADVLDELYPSFRMYLYDGRRRYSIPFTLFGYGRAAIYAGDVYLLIHARSTIRELAKGFDAHIRNAVVHAHECAAYVRRLANGISAE